MRALFCSLLVLYPRAFREDSGREILLALLVAAVVATLLPAWLAARLDPAQVLKQD